MISTTVLQLLKILFSECYSFSPSLEKHHHHVRLVLQRLLENRLFVKPEKCEFHSSSVSFLGYIIAQGQLKPDPAKIIVVTEWPVPTSLKELQRFLGFANFYMRFISNYSKESSPLTCLTSASSLFWWSPEAAAAFTRLKTLHRFIPIHPSNSWSKWMLRLQGWCCALSAGSFNSSPASMRLFLLLPFPSRVEL